jgi:hypothetical protein
MLNDTHPQYPPPQKRWIPKAAVATQAATKTEDETIAMQLSVDKVDRSALAVGPTIQPPKTGPSAPRQETFDDTPTPMDEGNIKEDDLMGEDLVNYKASPEHAEN